MNDKTITVELTDMEIDNLNDGFSLNKNGVLITFAEGSTRRCTE